NQGYNIVYTRNPNVQAPASLKQRADKVNQVNPDLFISVHHDSSTNTSTRGYSVHWSSYRYKIDKSGLEVVIGGRTYPFVSQHKKVVNGKEETFITYRKDGKNVVQN